MAFVSLADRISDMPLLICGPVLRRVETDSVTVWVAVKSEQKVWLEVYQNMATWPSAPNLKKIMAGEHKTISLGDHFHIIAVTARLVSGENPLTSGNIYFYNVFFTDINATGPSSSDPNLTMIDVTTIELHYDHEPEDLGPHTAHTHLPSFCIAPDDLNQLRIVHGSCRMPQAEGTDAMPGIDDMIISNRWEPDKRPHYLLLTGDQIYADDISPIILYILMDAEKSLFGTVEFLPTDKPVGTPIGAPGLPDAAGNGANFFNEKQVDSDNRARYDRGGFTSHCSFHLATSGEYMAYYLFMWSNILWQDMGDYPGFDIIGGARNEYDNHADSLNKFRGGLSQVRRAMANVPVYMIFDDHDVTDDWYMTYHWCETTLKNDLGRRMIMNGLLSYALFQAWGNTPELYADAPTGSEPKGNKLLQAAEMWFRADSLRVDPTHTNDKEPEIQKLVGIPEKSAPLIKIPGTEYYMINQHADALRWDYQVTRTNYEIKFLDGRTRRGYPEHTTADRGKQAHGDIISEISMRQQFDHDDASLPPKEITMIVVPTSLISIPAIELEELPMFVHAFVASAFKKDVYKFDFFDHWKNQSKVAEKFLKLLSERNAQAPATTGDKRLSRLVVLTGDVHFAGACRVEYENDDHHTIYAQVISSSFKKQDDKTRLLHQYGYDFTWLVAFPYAGKNFFFNLHEGIGNVIVRAIVWGVSMLAYIAIAIIEAILLLLDSTILKNLLDPKGMDARHFLGWNDPNQEGITKLLVPVVNILTGPDNDPVELKYDEIKLTAPAVIESNVLKDAKEPKLKFPDWQYRIDFIYADNGVRAPAPVPEIELTAPGPGDRTESLKKYLALAKNHMKYVRKWGNGKEIVGVNNISEVMFQWDENNKTVRQETWWRMKDSDGELKLFPLSNFIVPLNFKDQKFEMPSRPQTPN